MPIADTRSSSGAPPRRARRPPRRGLRVVLATLAGVLLAAALGGVAFVASGVYDISATEQHTRPVYALLDLTMKYSVRRRAAGIDVPSLNDGQQRAQGLRLFDEHCRACHGAPGVAPDTYAQLLQPLPGPLTHAMHAWRPQELFWIARHGVKMSAMPGWEGRLRDDELWAIVAFLQQLPQLSPQEYRRQSEAARTPVGGAIVQVAASGPPREATGQEAIAAVRRYGCHGCHVIPGVVGPAVVIGPPLERFGTRALIAGRWPNTDDNMVAWLMHPQAMDPRTAMPDLGVSPPDAALIARYLRAQR